MSCLPVSLIHPQPLSHWFVGGLRASSMSKTKAPSVFHSFFCLRRAFRRSSVWVLSFKVSKRRSDTTFSCSSDAASVPPSAARDVLSASDRRAAAARRVPAAWPQRWPLLGFPTSPLPGKAAGHDYAAWRGWQKLQESHLDQREASPSGQLNLRACGQSTLVRRRRRSCEVFLLPRAVWTRA